MFPMGAADGDEQCVTVTGIDDMSDGDTRVTVTIQSSSSYTIDGNGAGFSDFVNLTIVDDETG